jgi:hypothetical protein
LEDCVGDDHCPLPSLALLLASISMTRLLPLLFSKRCSALENWSRDPSI